MKRAVFDPGRISPELAREAIRVSRVFDDAYAKVAKVLATDRDTIAEPGARLRAMGYTVKSDDRKDTMHDEEQGYHDSPPMQAQWIPGRKAYAEEPQIDRPIPAPRQFAADDIEELMQRAYDRGFDDAHAAAATRVEALRSEWVGRRDEARRQSYEVGRQDQARSILADVVSLTDRMDRFIDQIPARNINQRDTIGDILTTAQRLAARLREAADD